MHQIKPWNETKVSTFSNQSHNSALSLSTPLLKYSRSLPEVFTQHETTPPCYMNLWYQVTDIIITKCPKWYSFGSAEDSHWSFSCISSLTETGGWGKGLSHSYKDKFKYLGPGMFKLCLLCPLAPCSAFYLAYADWFLPSSPLGTLILNLQPLPSSICPTNAVGRHPMAPFLNSRGSLLLLAEGPHYW